MPPFAGVLKEGEQEAILAFVHSVAPSTNEVAKVESDSVQPCPCVVLPERNRLRHLERPKWQPSDQATMGNAYMRSIFPRVNMHGKFHWEMMKNDKKKEHQKPARKVRRVQL